MKSKQTRIGVAALLCGMVIATLLTAFPTTTNAAPKTDKASHIVNATGQYCTVVVRRGEALYQIAARYHTTTAYLASINNLYNPNYIYAGMTLNVPCAPAPTLSAAAAAALSAATAATLSAARHANLCLLYRATR